MRIIWFNSPCSFTINLPPIILHKHTLWVSMFPTASLLSPSLPLIPSFPPYALCSYFSSSSPIWLRDKNTSQGHRLTKKDKFINQVMMIPGWNGRASCKLPLLQPQIAPNCDLSCVWTFGRNSHFNIHDKLTTLPSYSYPRLFVSSSFGCKVICSVSPRVSDSFTCVKFSPEEQRKSSPWLM